MWEQVDLLVVDVPNRRGKFKGLVIRRHLRTSSCDERLTVFVQNAAILIECVSKCSSWDLLEFQGEEVPEERETKR